MLSDWLVVAHQFHKFYKPFSGNKIFVPILVILLEMFVDILCAAGEQQLPLHRALWGFFFVGFFKGRRTVVKNTHKKTNTHTTHMNAHGSRFIVQQGLFHTELKQYTDNTCFCFSYFKLISNDNYKYQKENNKNFYNPTRYPPKQTLLTDMW